MTIEEALYIYDHSPKYPVDVIMEADEVAYSALRSQQAATEPLTLDELREMEDEPVWFVDLEDLTGEWRIIESVWSDEVSSEFEWQANFSTTSEDYGNTWLAYRTKPKEEQA